MKQTNEIVVALDIGTTKIVAMAGRKNEHGQLEVLGTGRVESLGVSRGVVSNIEKTVKAICEAIEEAERSSGVEVDVVQVGIAGQHIKSLQHRGMLTRNSLQDEISQGDIDDLIADMHKLALPPGDKIIHVIPQEYTVDNERGIADPIGMAGVRLEANFHIITGQVSAIKNLKKCVEKSALEMENLTLEPIASAASVLTEEEMEAGVVLIDIGGGTTDLAIFHEGIIRHTAVIPFGGNIVTQDIKEGCGVMAEQAEKLKRRFGCAMAEKITDSRVITIPGLKGRPEKEIMERNLAHIIQARMEEILDTIVWEIDRSGLARKVATAGIVLTGGGSLLKHLKELVEYHTGYTVRLGDPSEHLAHGYEEQMMNPIYATAIGLIINGIDNRKLDSSRELESSYENTIIEEAAAPLSHKEVEQPREKKSRGWSFSGLVKKAKNWLEADPDADL
ncbi:cell division protein FtsA [Saprospira grandis DSM 2844]|uniref:Cell division protein FtsA n=1 Tax=Saprospira grandis DSM 2844 TaxID=694433 RepID=J0P9B7_9BACT|nr:cell division protein FtsA [Saprospira grandis]EJF54152.1 cell division protein FtsA [Saprospira grandis DSM 2844]